MWLKFTGSNVRSQKPVSENQPLESCLYKKGHHDDFTTAKFVVWRWSFYINCLLRLHFISRAVFNQPAFINKQMSANYKP